MCSSDLTTIFTGRVGQEACAMEALGIQEAHETATPIRAATRPVRRVFENEWGMWGLPFILHAEQVRIVVAPHGPWAYPGTPWSGEGPGWLKGRARGRPGR